MSMIDSSKQKEVFPVFLHPRVVFGYFIVLLGALGWSINALFGLSETDSLIAGGTITLVCFGFYARWAIKRLQTEATGD